MDARLMFTSMQPSDRATSPVSITVSSAPTTDHLSRHVAWPLMVDSSTHQLSDSSPGGPGILFSGASPAPSGLAPWSACDHRRIRHPRRVASHVCVPRCDVRTSLRNLPAPASVSARASKGPIHVIPTTTKTIDEDAAAGGVNAGSSAAALTSLELLGPSRQPAFLRTAMGQRGSSEVGLSTNHTVAAPEANAFGRRKVGIRVALTERLSAPSVDAAMTLDRELTRVFRRDGVVSFEERRLLKLSRALVGETSRVDANLEVLVAGFRVDGIRSRNFRRKQREFDRDFDPEPSGPAASGVIVNEEAA